MKPMSPEEQELEDQRLRVSSQYRAGSTEAPPAHLDKAILAAARREVQRARLARNWHVPASIAAVLVIGVSLALMTSEIEDPLPPADTSAGVAAGEARQAAPAPVPAMKQESLARRAPHNASERELPPSRERSTRDVREADSARKSAASHADSIVSGPSVAAPAPPTALKQYESGVPTEPPAGKKSELADSAQEVAAIAALRTEAAPSSAMPVDAPGQWLQKIGELLRDGRVAQAREQLADFRKRYPDYRLPEALRDLEAKTKEDTQ